MTYRNMKQTNEGWKNLQYFSKTKKVWVDFKESDCEESLRKYHYQIRKKQS